ncbi:MAG TPA: ELWxxDGT repeat protein [Thermoanaerobaculia bacterium]
MIRSFRLLWALPLSLALAAPAYAGTAELLRDIQDQSPPSSTPIPEIRPLFAVRDKVVFVAAPSAGQPAVWVSDGTGPGTRVLANTCPTMDCGYVPEIVGVVNDLVFWVAPFQRNSPFRLWRSDGTRAGSFALTPIDPPLEIGYASDGWSVSLANRGLYFGSCTTERGCELWHSDGTVAGTRLVKSFGAEGSFHGMRFIQNRLYFFLGSNLWVSDGTAAGTVRLRTVSYPRLLTPAADRLYFLAEDSNGRQLWVSDGTSQGTRPLTQISSQEAFDDTSWIKASGNRVYFVANDVVHGYELWRSDGTPQGTRPITNFGYYRALWATNLADLEEIGSRVVFAATDGITGNRLWTTDGRPESTAPLTSACPAGCNASSLVKVGGKLLFLSNDEVWSTDGTAAGTRRVWARGCFPESCPLSGLLQPLLGKAVFTGRDSHGFELWWTDGTAAGTKRLTDMPVGQPSSGLVPSGRRFFFTGSSPYGEEIWVTDEQRETRLVTDTLPWAPGSDPTELVAAGDRLFFRACEGEHNGLWSTTGLPQTTVKVKDYFDSCYFTPPAYPRAIGERLLFFREVGPTRLWSTDGGEPVLLVDTAASGEHEYLSHFAAVFQGQLLFTRQVGSRLAVWKSDGTPAGTSEAFVLPSELDGADGLTLAGDEIYFIGYKAGTANVWRTDGTLAGTRKVSEGAYVGVDSSFTRAGSRVFFVAGDGLWKTNGTLAGTVRVRELPGDTLTDLTEFHGHLYFFASVQGEMALWRSDGTEAGTMALHMFPYRRDASEPPVADLTVFAGRLFFSADDGAHGDELWTSDGTAKGTRMALDILPGAFSSRPRELTTAGGKLFFSANDGIHGTELWESDGTEAGTRMVQDLAPDVASSSPEHLTAGGRHLYFSADDGISGREPWALDLTGPVSCQPSSTRLCLSGGRYQVEAFWRDFEGHAGRGQAVSLTPDTGYFWFFNASNVETVVKVLDGRGSNGHVWVFYGALSNVEYTLTVTDTQTGLTRHYFNPLRQFASVGDTHGFGPLGAYSSSPAPSVAAPSLLPLVAERTDLTAATGICQAGPERLCLNDNRFAVEVSWRDFQNRTGKGKAVSLTADTGYFWFFDDANVELVTKVLDGRASNGKHWFFYGALSNVEYTVTVTDTQTGRIKTYTNPRGRFASVGDTQAF